MPARDEFSTLLLRRRVLSRAGLLVPGGLAHPAEGEPCVRADLDGGGFRFSDRLLHRLHQILGVVDQHLGGLVRETERNGAIRREASQRCEEIVK